MSKKIITCPTCGAENMLPCEKCFKCGTPFVDTEQEKADWIPMDVQGTEYSKLHRIVQLISQRRFFLLAAVGVCLIIFFAVKISSIIRQEKVADTPYLRILSNSITLVLPEDTKKTVELTAGGGIPEAFDYKIMSLTGDGFSSDLSKEDGKNGCELIITAISEGEGVVQLGLIDTKTDECIATDEINVKIIDAEKNKEPLTEDAYFNVYSDTITLALPSEKQRTIQFTAEGSLPDKVDFQVLETTGSGFIGDWPAQIEGNMREFTVYGVSEGEGTVKIGLIDTETRVCIASKVITIKVIDANAALAEEKDRPASLKVFTNSVTLVLPEDIQRTINIAADGALPESFEIKVLNMTGTGFSGDWSGEPDDSGWQYTISAISAGEGNIELGLIDGSTDECIATTSIDVKVIDSEDVDGTAGNLAIVPSDEELAIRVAEQFVASFVVEGNIPKDTVFVSYPLGEEHFVDMKWGDLRDNSIDLTIIGTGKGKEAILVSMEDSSTNYVYASAVINITVN